MDDARGSPWVDICHTEFLWSLVCSQGIEQLSAEHMYSVTQILAALLPGRLDFVPWRLIIFGSLVWNLLRVTLLALRVLRWLLDFWNICVPVAYIRGLCVKWTDTCLRVPCNLKVFYVFLNVFHTTGMYTTAEKLQTPAYNMWDVLLVQLFKAWWLLYLTQSWK